MSQKPSAPVPAPPLPVPSRLTEFFWDAAHRHELFVQRCDDCGSYLHPPKPICRHCRSMNLTGIQVSGHATLYSWTTVEQSFHPYFEDKVPYVLATVELVEQPRLMFTSRLVECDESRLTAGMALEATFEDLSPEFSVPVFRPTPVPVSFGKRLGVLAARNPDDVAMIFAAEDGSEREITWSELEARSNQAARLLERSGAAQDDRVVVALRNSPEHLFVTFGAWKLGALPLPLRWDLPPWERDRLIAIADPSVVVADWPQPDPGTISRRELEQLATLSSQPPTIDRVPRSGRLIATSGATGTPKIVASTSPGLFSEGNYLPVLGDTNGKTSLVLSPLYHVNGFTFGAYTPLLQGARIVLMERFDAARAVDLIERHRVAFTVMVPTMLQRIARLDGVRDRDFASIELLIYGGASAPEWVIREWLELVPPERFVLSYGGTEGYGLVTTTGDAWLSHPGTCGTPLGCDVRIVDPERRELPVGEVGEILLRGTSGPPTFEYIGAPTPEPDPDGWGSFGDMGWVDVDGYLYIADRRQDMIVSGGANVFPAEVEAALSEHAGVSDSAVIGLPDEEWGQRVHAIVEPIDPSCAPSTVELQAHCRARLAAYKVPKTLELIDNLQRSSAGKLNRSALRAERTR